MQVFKIVWDKFWNLTITLHIFIVLAIFFVNFNNQTNILTLNY